MRVDGEGQGVVLLRFVHPRIRRAITEDVEVQPPEHSLNRFRCRQIQCLARDENQIDGLPMLRMCQTNVVSELAVRTEKQRSEEHRPGLLVAQALTTAILEAAFANHPPPPPVLEISADGAPEPLVQTQRRLPSKFLSHAAGVDGA